MIRALRRNKDPMAAPPYLSHYKLRENPFSGGPRYFFADPERAQTLNMLQHLTQYSEELLLVSGPAGSGKTTLLEQYLARADDDWKVCRVSAAETPDPAALFLAAARCFGLHTDGVASDALLGALQEHLNHLQQTMTPVLVVDDADRLSDDALEIVVRLTELPGEHGKLVRTILFADAAILPRFDSQRFATAPKPHRLDLKPLDEAQTIAYLQHRLATAGFAGGPLFQPRELKRIHKQSQGWPGGINVQAHEVLMSKRKSGAAAAWPYLAAGALIAAGAGAYWHFSGGNVVPVPAPPAPTAAAMPPTAAPERPILRYAGEAQATALVVRGGETVQITCVAPAAEPAAPLAQPMLREVTPPIAAEPPPAPAVAAPEPAPAAPAVAEAPTPEPAPAMAPAPEPAAPAMEAAPVEPAPVPEAAVPEPAPAEPAAPAAMEAPAMAQPVPAEPVAEPVPPAAEVPVLPVAVIERVEPDPAMGSRQPQSLILHGRNFTPQSQVTVSWRGWRKALAAAQVQVLDSSRIAIEITTGTTPDTWSVTVAGADGQVSEPFPFKVEAPKAAAPAAPAAAPAARSAAAAAGFRDSAWLKARDPRRYTVQLVGAGTEQAVRDHLNGYDVRGDIAQLVTRRDGKPWHVLFWGDFADRAAAERAVAALPAPLKKVAPWIRSYADVHGEVTAGGVGQ
jgi:DamX protein